MRFAMPALCAAISLAFSVPRSLAATPPAPQPPASASSASAATPAPAASAPALTLADALRLAEANDPVLLARQAQLQAAQGTAAEAGRLLRDNPQLEASLTRRAVPAASGDDTRREWSAGLSQSFEIGGQRGHRREAAERTLQAVQLEIEGTRQQQAAEVAQRFFKVLALQERQALEARNATLLEETARAIERRRAAGEDTRLDANVALVESERASGQRAATGEQLLEARAELARPLQWHADALPVVTGDLAPGDPAYTEADLLQSIRRSPRLQALAARTAAAEARLRLERSARTPDVTVSLGSGREGPVGARERLTTLGVSVPLPLFQRNEAAIGNAGAEAATARLEQEAAEREAAFLVQAGWQKLQSLRARVDRLQGTVLPALVRNEALATKSLRAGQISLLELIVARRQAIEARRDLIDALLDYQVSRLSLEATAGWTSDRH